MTQHSRNTPQFYLTAPSPCPYLPGKEERKVFTHLVGERAPELNELLTHGGFRRSQSIAYRPACDGCRACVSVRVLVDEFQPTRSMKRVLERNGDIVGNMRAAQPTSEQYSAFRAYLDTRHHDGGMVDMTVLDYAMMVEDSHVNTRMVEYRRRGPDSGITGRGDGDAGQPHHSAGDLPSVDAHAPWTGPPPPLPCNGRGRRSVCGFVTGLRRLVSRRRTPQGASAAAGM